MEKKNKIKFKELSTIVKIGVVGGLIDFCFNIIYLIAGLIGGL